jgi:nucleotide-binding universal stress UspA family protein
MRDFHPRRILVPTDYSPTSEVAIFAAQQVAERFGSELIVVNCDLVMPPAEFGFPTVAYVTMHDQTATEMRAKLQAWGDQRLSRGSVPYRVELRHEAPILGIRHAAEESDVDLIVMGTHGRTGFRRAILGSVTEGVLRATSRPVLTVHAPLTSELSRILCPVNFTPVARHALDYAVSLAESFDAELLILNVAETEGQLHDRPLQQWIPAQLLERCRYADFVAQGDAAEEIIRFAQENRVSLTVIGAEHHRFFDESVIGATSEKIVRHSPTPILTVVAPVRSLEDEDELAERTLTLV